MEILLLEDIKEEDMESKILVQITGAVDGSSVVFLIEGQHTHQSTSLGNMLAKTFFYISLIHY